MELKGCIFDLDGVIVDTARYHYLAWKRLAAEMGFEFTPEHNEALKGVSRMASLNILLSVGGIKKDAREKEALADRKNNWYVEYISEMTPSEILPGSVELLEKLRAEGILTAIGSASKNAGTILERIGLIKLFDTIVDGHTITNAKPDPEVFLKAAAELGIAPGNCVVFEDAVAGIEAALAGGMRCVGIGDKRRLIKANLVLPDLREITIEQLRQL